MRFTDPHWLLAGLLVCLVLIGTWYRHDARQQSALGQLVAPQLRRRLTSSVSWVRRFLQRSLLLGSVLCVCAALAEPLLGFHWEQVSRRGNEVVFAIDTSRSMLTQDVKPNRLTRAKLAIDDIARQLDGDAIGIVAFAGSAFLVCPPTIDYDAFQHSLDAVDTDTIPRGGTNIPSAIRVAQRAFGRSPAGDRILILVTDGENLEGDALAAAKVAGTQDGLKIYTVGVGTAAGDLIPLRAEQGGGFVRDENGDPVRSHLDETGLKTIAAATSGAYVHVGDQGEDFDALSKALGAVTKHDLIYRRRKVYNERYQWPLAAALIMLLASLLVGTRRSGRKRTPAVTLTLTVSVMSFVIAALVGPTRSESADQGIDPSRSGDSAAPIVDYNAGTGAYRAGKFLQAVQSFQQSIRSAPASDATRLADQQDAYYNLGDALYRAGQQLEGSDPEQAMQKWAEAVRAYDTALQLRADDADSKYNRDLVNRKIGALKRLELDSGGQGKGDRQEGGQGQAKTPTPSQNQQPPPPGQSQPQGAPRPQQLTPRDKRSGQHSSEQMSPEEARELLDSDKSEEHRALTILPDRRDSYRTPDTAFKNW